jgi:hypothetical protein
MSGMQWIAELRPKAIGQVSLSGSQDHLCQMPRALLQAGNEGQNQKCDEIFRTENDLSAPDAGNIPLDRRIEKKTRHPPSINFSAFFHAGGYLTGLFNFRLQCMMKV